jgi:hypothetical protein
MRNPGTAAVLSFILPGLGQIYNGCLFGGRFRIGISFGPSQVCRPGVNLSRPALATTPRVLSVMGASTVLRR